MTQLHEIAEKIRSKNAGPFWLTVDIFCGSAGVFERVSRGLTTEAVAARFKVDTDQLKRFDVAPLNTVKFSLPRPAVQGVISDRDMHGASFAQIVGSIAV